MQSVCIMGLGYIGLPTAGVLAQNGYQVLGVDVKQQVIETINRGEIHIVEPDVVRSKAQVNEAEKMQIVDTRKAATGSSRRRSARK